MLTTFNLKTNSVANYLTAKRGLKMSTQGTIKVNAKELNLDLTLLGGQSFR